MYLENVPRVADAITTCCVLHNLCIDGGESIEDSSNPSRLDQFEQEYSEDDVDLTMHDVEDVEDEENDGEEGGEEGEEEDYSNAPTGDLGSPLNFTSVRQYDDYQRQLRARAAELRDRVMGTV